jgi:TfoX/Sxy family transcriptional regulator of competence genes
MAYDEKLAEQVRAILATKPGFSEKKMFGGMCFLLAGNMCCGIIGEKLMIRSNLEDYEALLKQKHVEPMTYTGRTLRGMVWIQPEGLKRFDAVAAWVEKSVRFVRALPRKKAKPKAKSKAKE